MSDPDYESLLSETLEHWREPVYSGVLEDHVRPAVRIYAHASLSGLSDPPDVSGCFPLMPDETSVFDHYGNSIFARLSSACTSIRSALQAIQARTDGHSAIAISRRAHESLWQTFWLANPKVDADTRVHRLLTLTAAEIKQAMRVFRETENTLVYGNLQQHLDNIKHITTDVVYKVRYGRDEYTTYFLGRANHPPSDDTPTVPEGIVGAAFAWDMMSNMTHPNMVFDLIMQTQPDYQDLMNSTQVDTVNYAVGCALNIATTLMERALLPNDKIDTVNRALRQPVDALTQLYEMQREPNE